ncbi:ribonuclease D [Oceanisphaera litoralis]|uniref:3'-5' exonuclease n=1 Tax=Oceanisphaera litoralis TaxID=225144 RepID=UPI00195B7A26|nr:3'-5' exonuclease [Oceanisphaera litoralis]MBM7457109.1 ribonuclease D [Oceanisphaera litoralis]
MDARQYLERPTKNDMRELPEFSGLPLDNIHLVESAEQVSFARAQLGNCTHVGFDTESKPTFMAGEASTGPHVVQLASPEHAFLFTAKHLAGHALMSEILQSDQIIKVGFGLKSDRGPIQRLLGVGLRTTIELSVAVKRLGYRQQVGLQAAVAIVLGEYLPKSRKVTLSNWAAASLSPAQQSYAANDAYASLRVYLALARTAPQLLPPG